MRNAFVLAALLCPALACAASIDVVPLPARYDLQAGRLLIAPSFSIGAAGVPDERLERGARRFLAELARKTGYPLELAAAGSRPALIVRVGGPGEKVQDEAEDESYVLEIAPSGAVLTAATTVGALRGLETMLQLVRVSSEGFSAPAVTIEDRPRFAWRGLLIDAGRHFMPVDAIERQLDAMAAVKMNVLHWHLSDDQGFRVESRRFPRLHELGSLGQYYTQDQIREVVAYARDRGIRVVPEFDMPGHSQSWFAGYPDLASGPGPYAVQTRFGIFDPAMDPTRESTYRFLDKFVGEMARLFPDRTFHIGGDEVNGKQWDGNPRVQAFLRAHGLKDDAALEHYFDLRVQKILAKYGKVMAGWEEVLGPGLPKDTVVQAWRSQDTLAGAVRQGYRGLLSYGYYLDYMWPAARHYAVEPLSGQAASLTPEEQARVLGGEACEWSEGVTAEDLDSRVWPRTAAVAERLWSPREVTGAASLYARLDSLSERFELFGLRHRSGPAFMLRRIAGGPVPEALRVLAEAVVPVHQEIREDAAKEAGREMTTATALNTFGDAVPPESDSARVFSTQADAYLAGDRAAGAALRRTLEAWAGNDERLEPVLARSFLLAGLSGLSQQLSALGQSGLEALRYVDEGRTAPREWAADQAALLEKAAQPRADVRFAVVDAVKKLVDAAAGAAPAKTAGP